jgi:hypothetical protein
MANPLLAVMKKYKSPMTREEFINLRYAGNPPAEIGPEDEEEMPDQFKTPTEEDIAEKEEGLSKQGSGPITLHHWSNIGGMTETDPEKMGTGKPGREQARKNDPGFLPRTHFGDDTYKEPAIQGQRYHYTADVDSSAYYDIAADPEGLWQAGFLEGGATGAENAVYRAGYDGYFHDGAYVSFVPVPVKQVGDRQAS